MVSFILRSLQPRLVTRTRRCIPGFEYLVIEDKGDVPKLRVPHPLTCHTDFRVKEEQCLEKAHMAACRVTVVVTFVVPDCGRNK